MGLQEEYIMAADVYTDENDFIREYNNEHNDKFEVNWGMDFTYKGKEYHFARYPAENQEMRKEYEKILGYSLQDCVFELILNEYTPNNPFSFYNITIIGFYKTIYDVLDSTVIDDKPFRKVLASNEIIVTGKD